MFASQSNRYACQYLRENVASLLTHIMTKRCFVSRRDKIPSLYENGLSFKDKRKKGFNVLDCF